jgi:hypothetical protein
LKGSPFWWQHENLHFSKWQKITKSVYKHFYFAYISAWENDKLLIFFAKDAPWEALQKLHKASLLTCFMQSFPVLNMNNLHSTTTSQQNKNVRKMFLFCNYRACVVLSKAHLSKKRLRFYHFLKSRYSENKNVFQTFLFCWEVALLCRLFIMSKRNATRAIQ